MNFLCRCCKSRITKGNRTPQMIESAGIHDVGYRVEWMEEPEGNAQSVPVHERQWIYSNQQPVIGEDRILKVEKPFDENIGDEFTTIFEPFEMFMNGWDCAESPEDIDKVCAVRCRFDEVLRADDFSAFITVRVLNVVPLHRLYEVIPETVTDYPFFEDFGICEKVWTEYEDEHRLYREWNAQGDVGQEQLICTDDNGIRHEVLTSEWDMHDDFYYFHNLVNKKSK